MSGIRTLNNKTSLYENNRYNTYNRDWNIPINPKSAGAYYGINAYSPIRREDASIRQLQQPKIRYTGGYPGNMFMKQTNKVRETSQKVPQKLNSTSFGHTQSLNSHQRNGRGSHARIKTIHSSTDLRDTPIFSAEKRYMQRYFSSPVDLRQNREVKALPKATKNPNKETYRILQPIGLKSTPCTALAKRIKYVYRSRYQEWQPLYIPGESNIQVETLADMNEHMSVYIKAYKPEVHFTSQNEYRNAPGLNDSFELSFDGKALDRSDILRMVDSFSLAVSDDEDEAAKRPSTANILPAEILGS